VDEIARSAIFEEVITLEVNEPSPAMPENIKKIAGVKRCDCADNRNRIFTVTNTAGSQNLARILEVAAPYVLLSVTAKKATLEDAFLALTGKKLRDEGSE
jgi:hypothetical protein